MVLGLKPMGKLDTLRAQVLNRTKVLHGPELKPMGKLDTFTTEVLDRTKVLHGPQTQTYGETKHSHNLNTRQN